MSETASSDSSTEQTNSDTAANPAKIEIPAKQAKEIQKRVEDRRNKVHEMEKQAEKVLARFANNVGGETSLDDTSISMNQYNAWDESTRDYVKDTIRKESGQFVYFVQNTSGDRVYIASPSQLTSGGIVATIPNINLPVYLPRAAIMIGPKALLRALDQALDQAQGQRAVARRPHQGQPEEASKSKLAPEDLQS